MMLHNDDSGAIGHNYQLLSRQFLLPKAGFSPLVLSMPVFVCVSVPVFVNPKAHLHDSPSPIQARTTKFGQKNAKHLG